MGLDLLSPGLERGWSWRERSSVVGWARVFGRERRMVKMGRRVDERIILNWVFGGSAG